MIIGKTFYDQAVASDFGVINLHDYNTLVMRDDSRNRVATGSLLVLSSATNLNVNSNSIDFDAGNWACSYYDWIVPEGLYQISALAVGAGGQGGDSNIQSNGAWGGGGGGGGALAYSNNIRVYPGETLRIFVGKRAQHPAYSLSGNGGGPSGIFRVSNNAILLRAVGGYGGRTGNSAAIATGGDPGQAIYCVGQTAYSGAAGTVATTSFGGNGGAAAGYGANGNSGSGGAPSNLIAAAVAGSAGGGGVGLLGQGTSGTANTNTGGSGGAAGTTASGPGGNGGNYGGGGQGADAAAYVSPNYEAQRGGAGATGAVRILWSNYSDASRSWPSTNTSVIGTETTITIT